MQNLDSVKILKCLGCSDVPKKYPLIIIKGSRAVIITLTGVQAGYVPVFGNRAIYNDYLSRRDITGTHERASGWGLVVTDS